MELSFSSDAEFLSLMELSLSSVAVRSLRSFKVTPTTVVTTVVGVGGRTGLQREPHYVARAVVTQLSVGNAGCRATLVDVSA